MEKVGCTRQYESELSLRSFAQPFPSGDKGCANRPTRCYFFRKPTSPPLTLREGPPLSPSPFPLRVQGMCQPPYSVLKPLRYMDGGPSEVFSKTYPSFLTLKEGSTAFSKPFSPQGTRDVPTALLGAQTASLYGWRTIRGLRQQQSCGFLCGDEPALLKSCLWNRRDIRIDA